MRTSPGLIHFAEILQTSIRSWWAPVAGACLGAAAGLILWQDLPKTYEAHATLLATPTAISQEIGGRNASGHDGDVAVRLAALRESVMSRPFLERVEQRLRRAQPDADLPNDLGKNLDAQVIRFDDRRGAGVFELTFKDGDPQRSARVLNGLVDQYIDDTLQQRSTQAAGSASVFAGLAEDLRRQLEQREKQIAAFKSRNLHALPENRDATMRMMESRQRDLESLEREISDQQGQRDVLAAQAELARTLPAAAVGGENMSSARESRMQRVGRLQNELAGLRLRYTDSHPAVRMKREELQRAIDAPRDELASTPATGSAENVPDEFTPRIQATDREIARLRAARDAIRAQLGGYESRLTHTPRVDQQLAELTKDYDVLLEKYRDYQMKAEIARGTQKAEGLRRNEQFEVIQRAVAPGTPVSPKPVLLIGAGLLLGLLLFGGPVLARAALAPPVVSREGLRLISPVPVLATIGELHTARARRARLRRSVWSWSAVAVSVAVLALTAARFLAIG